MPRAYTARGDADYPCQRQKLDYIHEPKRCYVDMPEHGPYSSVRNYAGGADCCGFIGIGFDLTTARLGFIPKWGVGTR